MINLNELKEPQYAFTIKERTDRWASLELHIDFNVILDRHRIGEGRERFFSMKEPVEKAIQAFVDSLIKDGINIPKEKSE